MPPAPTTSRLHLAWRAGWQVRLLLAVGLLCLAAGASAQALSEAASHPLPALEQLAARWVQQTLAGETATAAGSELSLRPEVEVGQLDSRLRLAPCQQVQPYLPKGTRLWGPSRIGLRCADSSTRWSVFLPITVRVWGPAWQVQRAVAPGAVLQSQDAAAAEVDWAEHPSAVLADPADWVGAVAARGLMPGQVLRQAMVRPVQVFRAGADVRVVVQQAQLRLVSSGRAMGHGFVGHKVRIRMANGKTVQGRVRKDSSVVVEL